MYRGKKKKLLAALVIFCICFVSLPGVSFAADDETGEGPGKLWITEEYKTEVTESNTIAYINGGKLSKTVNSKQAVIYTDLAVADKKTEKLLVGVTATSVTALTANAAKGSVTQFAKSQIATVKVKNKAVTVTAEKNTGVARVWVALLRKDTGTKQWSLAASAKGDVSVEKAPKKLRVSSDKTDTIKKLSIAAGEFQSVYVIASDGAKPENKLGGLTVSAESSDPEVAVAMANEEEDGAYSFIIQGVGVKKAKATNAKINFICRENNKKVTLTVTVNSPARGFTLKNDSESIKTTKHFASIIKPISFDSKGKTTASSWTYTITPSLYTESDCTDNPKIVTLASESGFTITKGKAAIKKGDKVSSKLKAALKKGSDGLYVLTVSMPKGVKEADAQKTGYFLVNYSAQTISDPGYFILVVEPVASEGGASASEEETGVKATSVNLNKTTANVAVGDKLTLTASLVPADSTDTITWTCHGTANRTLSNTTGSTTTVTFTGLLDSEATTAICQVTATASSGVSKTCSVTVSKSPGGGGSSGSGGDDPNPSEEPGGGEEPSSSQKSYEDVQPLVEIEAATPGEYNAGNSNYHSELVKKNSNTYRLTIERPVIAYRQANGSLTLETVISQLHVLVKDSKTNETLSDSDKPKSGNKNDTYGGYFYYTMDPVDSHNNENSKRWMDSPYNSSWSSYCNNNKICVKSGYNLGLEDFKLSDGSGAVAWFKLTPRFNDFGLSPDESLYKVYTSSTMYLRVEVKKASFNPQ